MDERIVGGLVRLGVMLAFVVAMRPRRSSRIQHWWHKRVLKHQVGQTPFVPDPGEDVWATQFQRFTDNWVYCQCGERWWRAEIE